MLATHAYLSLSVRSCPTATSQESCSGVGPSDACGARGGRSAAAAGSHCSHEAYAAGAAPSCSVLLVLQFCGLLETDPTYSAAPKSGSLPAGLGSPWGGSRSWQAVQADAMLLLLMWQPVAARGPFWQLLLTRALYVLLHTASAGLGDSCLRQWLPRSSRSPALLRLSPKNRSRAGAAGARGAVQAGAPSLAVVCLQGVWHHLVLCRRVWLQVQGEMLPRLVLYSVASLIPPACPPARNLVAAVPFLRRISRFRETPWDGICCSQCAAGSQLHACGHHVATMWCAMCALCSALLPSAAPGAGGPSFWPCLQPRRHSHHSAT
jgi:hypothetical protein